MAPKGHKITWATPPVVIPPIPSKVEADHCIQAGDFVPAQAPFLPAPIENYYIAATGTAIKVIKFSPSVKSAASVTFSNRWIAYPGTPFYTVNIQLNLFTDNASLNDFSFNLHHYSASTPASSLVRF